jgi:hypothetical protein
MYKLFTLAGILCMSLNIYAQINPADSTAQVIGYWQNKEKQSYNFTYEKYKVVNADTSAREIIQYQVDITITDSTGKGYTIEWAYKNYNIQSDNQIIKKIASLAKDKAVVLRTNELGTIQEVVNWKEIREYMQKTGKLLEKEMKDFPNAQQIIAQVMNMYMSKESIEANAIKDALQFYTFHGAKYTLGEKLTGKVQLMNNFGGKPFDTELSVSLDEIDQENDIALIRMYQNIDSQQLTDATYAYLKTVAPAGKPMPAKDKFPLLTNETWTASQIHGGSGWVIYSIETKQTMAEGIVNVEERTIELK